MENWFKILFLLGLTIQASIGFELMETFGRQTIEDGPYGGLFKFQTEIALWLLNTLLNLNQHKIIEYLKVVEDHLGLMEGKFI